MPKSGVTHDITIACTDGSNKFGFMLLRDRRQLRRYGLRDAEQLAARFLSNDELTEADAPPALRLRWFAEGWEGGIGAVTSEDHNKWLSTSTLIDTTVDGKIKPAPAFTLSAIDCCVAAPTSFVASGFAVVGTELWSFVGRDAYEWSYTGTDWINKKTPQALGLIYRNGEEFGANTFVPAWDSCDEPAKYIYKADADACWSVIGCGTATSFKYFAKTRNACGNEILVGGYEPCSPHTIRTTTNPTCPNQWTTQTAVGEADAPITGLVQGNFNEILIFKTNGVWTFTAGGVVENITPEFEFQTHPNNFKGAHNWNGHIIMPLGGGGMISIIGDRSYKTSMSLYAPEQCQFHGRVAAVGGDADYLNILVHDSANTKYHLLRADWLNVVAECQIDYHWHHIGCITYTTGTDPDHAAIFADGTVGPCCQVHQRIWAGVESTGSNLLPYFSPGLNDVQFGYSNSASMVAQTVEDTRGFRNIEKAYQQIDIEHANLGAGGRQFTVKYSIDGGAYLSNLLDACCNGDSIIDSTGNTSTLRFPRGTSGKTLALQFVPASTCSTATAPAIDSFSVTGQLRPDPVKLLPLNIYLADEQLLLNGGIESITKRTLAQLRTWDAQAAEVAVEDAEGNSKDMVMLPNTFAVREVNNALNRRNEYVASMVFAEV